METAPVRVSRLGGMSNAHSLSLKSLIRRYQFALLLILAAAAGVGGLWANLWQSGYQASLRLNGLLVEAQAVRGDLYRQIRAIDEVRARGPREDYWQRLYRIDEHFYRMRGYAETATNRRVSPAWKPPTA